MKNDRKTEVTEMRMRGLSAREISKETGIPRSTIGRLIEGVVLSKEAKERLAAVRVAGARDGCRKGSISNKQISDQRHQEAFEAGYKKAKTDKDFAIVCALYWGEGGKTRRCFSFTNSDSAMLGVVSRWLHKEEYEYKVDVRHHEDGTKEDDIREFWSLYLGVSLDRISKVRWIEDRKSKRTIRKMPHGCVQILVHDSLLHTQVMGGICCIRNEYK